MSTDAALAAVAREVLDRVRYLVLGTVDPDGRPRTSPVYAVPSGYRDLYWVSDPASHHSRNLRRDDRAAGVVFDSTVPPGPEQQAVYVTGRAQEIGPEDLAAHLPRAFRPERGGRAFAAEELTGTADLRLWRLAVHTWEVHVSASHPALGTGSDRRVRVDPGE